MPSWKLENLEHNITGINCLYFKTDFGFKVMSLKTNNEHSINKGGKPDMNSGNTCELLEGKLSKHIQDNTASTNETNVVR